MNFFYSLLVSLLFSTLATVQGNEPYGTTPMDSANFVSQPWYGNNQFLLDILDIIGYVVSY